MPDDTLRGYTITGSVHQSGDVGVVVTCDRCEVTVIAGWNPPLLDVVQAAVEHSGRCTG